MASGSLLSVIDNPTNFEKNPTGHAQLPILASHLPTSGALGIDATLIGPVREYVSRDSKQVRAQLVRIGFSFSSHSVDALTSHDETLLDCLACVVEALHAGSLMIDDIQDVDDVRRGKPALHMQIGVPRTINAANWLYFWPTDLLRQQSLKPEIELEIYRLFHKTMIRAHQGQALDLAYDMTKTPQSQAAEISVEAIELKTGELMAMCAELGAILGAADGERRSCLARFGLRFGVTLQMFNDIGDLSSRRDSGKVNRPLIRPSWLWAVAAQELSSADFSRFQSLMAGPSDSSPEDELLIRAVVEKATKLALAHLETCMDEIDHLVQTDAHRLARSSLRELAQKVMRAYA